MKRIAAVLLSVVFWLTALPWGAVSAAMEGNIITNGDFEDGKTGWSCNSGTAEIVSDAYSGNSAIQLTNPSAWGEAAIQTVEVQADTDYTVTWYSKRVSGRGAFNFFFMSSNGWSNLTVKSGQNWMNETSGNWVKNEVVLNTGATTQAYLKLSAEAANAGSILIDNITMIPVGWQPPDEPDVPSDNLLINGDFETGDHTGWDNFWGSNTISITEGHDSAYAMSVISGEWRQIRQKVAVEPNTDYFITGWYKDVNRMVLIVKDGADSKNLCQAAFTDGVSEWQQITVKVNSGSETSLLITLIGYEEGARGIFDDFSMKKATDEPATGELINGNFEQWSEGWYLNPSSAYISGESSYSGHYSLALDNPSAWSEAATQTIAVEPYTEYVITWYSQRVSGYGTFNLALLDAENSNNLYITDGQSWMNETSGDWVQYRLLVSTGDCTQMMMKWTAEYYNPGKILIDNITMEENEPDAPIWTEYPPIEENQLVNGGFEEGDNGWIWWDSTRLDDTTAFQGNCSAHLEQEKQWNEALTQRVPLRPDTDYVIIFYTKRESGRKAWSLFLMDAYTVDSGSPVNIRFKPSKSTNWFQQPASDGWVKTELEFNSGDIAEAMLKFAPTEDNAGTFWLDNVGLYVKGYEPKDEPEPEPKEPMTLTSISATNNRPLSEEVNLLENGSFEGVGGQWDVDSFCTEHVSVVEDATTKWGNHSLYFDTTSSPEEEAQASFTVAVEPYTTYVFSVWIKGAFLSENNCGRATIGVAGENGRFLSNRDILFSNTTRQLVPSAWDDAWHLGAVMFETHNNTTATILMAGWGSQMWVDDMALYREIDGTMYMPANMSGSVEVSYNPQYTACKDEDSLIPDPTMSTADASGFWADAYGWRNGFMSFKDGAMKYTSTGDNAATYTIKWVDVEPYTDYTFSVDLKILEDGFGRIALLDSKKLDKVEFYSISFDSYDYTDWENTDWRTVAVRFNSDAYDRIGIAFVDDGGEVLLDNMRLFKTEDGMAALIGDVNGDGTINTRDVGLLQRHLSGWDVVILTEVADVNGDSKVNVQDIAVLQRYLCGWDVRLGG